ncbi:hypothetical protein JX265_004645 [Neoarthrinium moseri]|uniref:Major facilitator superfamily (MFS) profile domain-containing protein n=1 Tax=Neoarthrinium moseri TaxID=1658444 RepID=A0A9Q0AQP4_9PEZI|nr:hypothetical protein JX265_004645 [Neoarthrinium moseri]
MNPETSGSTSDTLATDLESRHEATRTAQEKVESDSVVDWDGPDDPHNPRNWSSIKRHAHVVFVSLFALYGNLAATMYAPGAAQLVREFGIGSEVLAAFTVTIYLLGFAIGPLFISPLSEVYGRMVIIHICNVIFIAFTVGCAVSTSTAMFFVFRFMAGCACSAPMTIGGAVIADVTPPEERGRSMAIWGIGPLLGPVIGPIIGGFIAQRLSWRWTFWVISILASVVLLIGLICMRETNSTILLRRKAEALRKETGNLGLFAKADTRASPTQVLRRALARPTRLLLFSPIVTLLSIYSAIVVGLIYLLFTTFPSVFESQYGFSTETSGLSYLGVGIGMFIGIIAFGVLNDKVYTRLKGENDGAPEMRLPLMMVVSPFLPVGFFWYGWSAQAQAHWIVPIIGTSLIGIGSLFVIMPSQIYLVDAFGPESAASALAANTIVRVSAGAFLSLAGPPMYSALGFGWGNSILGFLCLACVPLPFLFYRYVLPCFLSDTRPLVKHSVARNFAICSWDLDKNGFSRPQHPASMAFATDCGSIGCEKSAKLSTEEDRLCFFISRNSDG